MRTFITFLLALFCSTLLTTSRQQSTDGEAYAAAFDNRKSIQDAASARKPEARTGEPAPKPEHKPETVVGFQLEALRKNDEPSPDSGIRTAFRFASPENREVTGPIEKFILLVKNPLYSPLLNHKEAMREPVRVRGNAAQQRVRVVTAGSDVAVFIFTLSKQQSGEYKDCWMTEAVEREEEPERKDDRRGIA